MTDPILDKEPTPVYLAHKTPATCRVHKYHSPTNLTIELHHVIPQAWQRYMQEGRIHLSDEWYPLWDPRTEPLCPTGHRNVHMIIVDLMKRVPYTSTENVVYEVTREANPYRRHSEWEMACQALLRFMDMNGAGGLHLLTEAGYYGEA